VHGVCRAAPAGDVIAVTVDGYQVLHDVQVHPIAGMAPALDLVEVTADVALDIVGPVDWTAGVAAAHLALAHELVGTSRTMLRLAREHALEREQFGRPIASFQAIRHRLAEALIAVEAAQAAADSAWDAPGTEMLAKAVAGRSARIVARHAQQVLAGMGFTTEHHLHRYVRRALVLDGLFGSSRMLAREVGDQALRTRQLPRPIPL
jgi:alkylation response protein AidB-like acyl-CoA dehydrogenase